MTVLVINCGSTSIKLAAIDVAAGQRIAELRVERLMEDRPSIARWSDGHVESDVPPSHEAALRTMIPSMLERLRDHHLEAVGHRVVHGGEIFRDAQVIDDSVETAIENLASLAPLHNPINLAGIRTARQCLPNLPQVAVFDTAFHGTLPTRAKTYAIDRELAASLGVRRFGFHGTSHQFVAHRATRYLGENLEDLRIVTCHLGGGCSITAVEYGRSVETSMGMTPLEGLVMATRSGDLDPGIIFHAMRTRDASIDEVETWLNHKSGLAGLSGIGGDMRDIEAAAEEGDLRCQQALQVFCHRLRKYIGAYAAVMGGVDVIVFTGGIGENSAAVRHRVAQRLDFLGCRLDESRNRAVSLTTESPVAEFAQAHSRVKLLAVATDEMLAIAEQTDAATRYLTPRTASQTIPVAISARHVHLTEQAVEALFGAGHSLTPMKDLSQPGQFACEECVTLVGPKRSIEGVRVLGPPRGVNQVEISRTDEFFLGIDAPVRASGHVENTPGITLVGAEGRAIELRQGVICALRHIHMTPDDASAFGVQNGDLVEVEVGHGTGRSLTFGDVLIRVKPSYVLEMHIDTDEGNAAELQSLDRGELEPTDGQATLRRRTRHP